MIQQILCIFSEAMVEKDSFNKQGEFYRDLAYFVDIFHRNERESTKSGRVLMNTERISWIFSEAGIHNWPLFPCLIITVLKHCKDRGFISHPVQCWGCQGCYSKLIRQLPSQNQAPPSRDIKHGQSKDASAPNQIFIIEYRVHSVHSVHYHFLMS